MRRFFSPLLNYTISSHSQKTSGFCNFFFFPRQGELEFTSIMTFNNSHETKKSFSPKTQTQYIIMGILNFKTVSVNAKLMFMVLGKKSLSPFQPDIIMDGAQNPFLAAQTKRVLIYIPSEFLFLFNGTIWLVMVFYVNLTQG